MKRKLLFTVGAAMTLLSATAAGGYHITGTAEGVEPGDTVFLCEMQGLFSMMPTDTTVIDKNGKFAFTGDFDGASIRFMLPMHEGKPTAMAEFLLENADIELNISMDPKKPATVKGGPAFAMYEDYQKGCKVYDDEIDKPWSVVLDSTATKEAKAIAQAKVDSLQALKDNYTKLFVINHIPSAISDYLYVSSGAKFTEPEATAVEKLMDAGHHYHYYQQHLDEKAAEAATAVGSPYTDFAMPTPQGKTIKVSDYVGKNQYTLIDFWASWCGPCRAEMPTVVKAYNTYHKKGFEVVGVSFDSNKAAWTKAIKSLKLPWPHMSDLKGWGCAAASLYNIKGIPANVLVDKNGTIVAKNLRGEDLLNKLADLMK